MYHETSQHFVHVNFVAPRGILVVAYLESVGEAWAAKSLHDRAQDEVRRQCAAGAGAALRGPCPGLCGAGASVRAPAALSAISFLGVGDGPARGAAGSASQAGRAALHAHGLSRAGKRRSARGRGLARHAPHDESRGKPQHPAQLVGGSATVRGSDGRGTVGGKERKGNNQHAHWHTRPLHPPLSAAPLLAAGRSILGPPVNRTYD